MCIMICSFHKILFHSFVAINYVITDTIIRMSQPKQQEKAAEIESKATNDSNM